MLLNMKVLFSDKLVYLYLNIYNETFLSFETRPKADTQIVNRNNYSQTLFINFGPIIDFIFNPS